MIGGIAEVSWLGVFGRRRLPGPMASGGNAGVSPLQLRGQRRIRRGVPGFGTPPQPDFPVPMRDRNLAQGVGAGDSRLLVHPHHPPDIAAGKVIEPGQG